MRLLYSICSLTCWKQVRKIFNFVIIVNFVFIFEDIHFLLSCSVSALTWTNYSVTAVMLEFLCLPILMPLIFFSSLVENTFSKKNVSEHFCSAQEVNFKILMSGVVFSLPPYSTHSLGREFLVWNAFPSEFWKPPLSSVSFAEKSDAIRSLIILYVTWFFSRNMFYLNDVFLCELFFILWIRVYYKLHLSWFTLT